MTIDGFRLRHTRRRDRWLVLLWPPKRRRLRQMEMALNFVAQQEQDAINQAVIDAIVYGKPLRLRWTDGDT